MCNVLKRFLTAGLLLMLVINVAYAEELSRQQIKGLDEQVQEIKSDVLSIAVDLNRLEERLLYPSLTQVSIFVSLVDKESLQLDSVEIQLDGEVMANHLYTYKELEALHRGGVQRIYTGNLTIGDHDIQVSMRGKSPSGADIHKIKSFSFVKDVSPGIVDVALAYDSISLEQR